MQKHSFTIPISFLRSQIGCLWSKRLLPVLISLILVLGLISVINFYNYRAIAQQIKILEDNLVNFDQAVRDKHNLISEQSRLAQKLGAYKVPINHQYNYDLLNYLLDIANLIPVNLVLNKLEVISGDQMIVEGFGSPPDQIIDFWRKLLSLDYIIDGKLEKLAQNQFVLQLKIKRT